MKLFSIGLTAIGLYVLACSPTLAAPTVDVPLPPQIAQAKKLTIGINCAYPPAGYVGLDGKPAGFEYTLVKRIAEYAFGTGPGLETQCVNEGNRIPFLTSGKVDLVLASLAWTAARAEQIDYSDPIWVSNLQLVVPKDSPIKNYGDLAGRSVVTPTGSTYQTWLQKCYPEAKLVTAQTAAEGATMLTQGRVDSFAYIDVYNYNFTQRNPGYKVVGDLAASAVQGIGVKKDNKPVMEWINAVLKDLRSKDAFLEAFTAEINDPGFTAKYKGAVPGPNMTLSYANSGALECLKK